MCGVEATRPIRIPADLHREIKTEAAVTDTKMIDLAVTQLRKRWKGNSQDRRKARRAK
jgi:hypothetical protein